MYKQIFPDSHKLLTQPTIWIGDTAATIDMMPHDIGMINKQTSKESVSIVMGNKQIEKSVTVGVIPCIMCDNQGHHVMHGTMKDVVFIPDCTFNLFSISKRLKQGWKLGGSKEALVLTSPNGKYLVKFDITISTPNGHLYAMCIARKSQEVAGVATAN